MKNKTRAKYEKREENTLYLMVSSCLDPAEQIIWEHGGSVSRMLYTDGYVVCFPLGTKVVDTLVDEENDYECSRWVYTIQSKDKLIWMSATSDGTMLPVLHREKSPWTNDRS